jgi:hypothetical protein
VGSLLQSTIGDLAQDFNVVLLSDRVFSFSVSCKQVGFFIYHLQFFKCDNFVVYFHLWNDGGPNWQREFLAFDSEEESSWQKVQSKKLSYAEVAKKKVLTGANSTPIHNHKVWRPRISVYDLANPTTKTRVSAFDRLRRGKGRISVFDRLGKSNHAASDLIPRKSVFDRLQLDLDKAQRAKNKGRVDHAERASHAAGEQQSGTSNFQNSNSAGNQGRRFCIRCLKPGHWRSYCQSKVTCWQCKQLGHRAAGCPAT